MKSYTICNTEFSVQARQTKTKGKVYDVYFKVITPEGDEKQKKLSGFKTKTLASSGYHEWIAENAVINPKVFAENRKAEKSAPTVGSLIEEYFLSIRGQNKDSVVYEKKNTFDLWIIPKFGRMSYADLTSDVVREWQDELTRMENPRTGKLYTIKYFMKIRSHLSAFCEWVKEYYGYQNPVADVKKPSRGIVKHQYAGWSYEQVQKFLDVVDDPMWRCFFTIIYFTGRRKGEVFALSPADITDEFIVWNKSVTRKVLDSSEASYAVTSTKEDKEAMLPYSDRVRESLQVYYYDQAAPFLFGGDRPLADKTTTNVFNRYTQKAGLPRIRLHDLRGSMISHLLDKGANPAIVADLVGDTVDIIMKNYYKRSKAAIAKVVSEFV